MSANVRTIHLLQNQQNAIQKLLDKTTVAVCYGGGAGGGKSYLGCIWLYVLCISYPGVKCFIGREELKRIKQSTLKTLFNVLTASNLKNNKHYRYHVQDSTITFYNGSSIDLLDLKKIPSDPMFERFGSTEYTAGFIEEGGEVEFEAYEVLKTRVGRWKNKEYGIKGKILITCNPKKNWLYDLFYKPWKEGKLASNLAFIQSLAESNTFLDSAYLETLADIKNKVQRQRLKDGIWDYDDSEHNLFKGEFIQSLFSSSYVVKGHKHITADIARFGRDKTVIMLWEGLRCEQVITLEKKSITEVAQYIKDMQQREKIPNHAIIVDEDGIGGGVKDILHCHGFIANQSAIRKANFANIKAQCYYHLSELAERGQVYVRCDEVVKHYLSEELNQVRWDVMDTDKKLRLESKDEIKKRLGRSPDYADALMLRMFFEIRKLRPDKK